MDYIIPEFNQKGFNCPVCNAYSNQDWKYLYGGYNGVVSIATCQLCNSISIWLGNGKIVCSTFDGKYFAENNKMIYPRKSGIPLPNEDLDDEIKIDYLEARNILNDSPRGSCALLRLALQKLITQLGGDGKKLNESIGKLVKEGLNITVQQALDSVRVIGNEAVHPGELDLKDDIETATKMFGLINIIADVLITQPKNIQELYGNLPKGTLKGIKDRDS